MKTLATLSCLALLSPLATAQVVDSWVVPKAFATQNASSTNSFPWTYTGYVRMQQAIDASEMGFPRLIHGMSLRPRTWGTAQQQPFTLSFSIKLSLCANPVNQLSGTYANNVKGTQVEVFRGPLYFHTPSGNSPAEFSVVIPFTKQFLYIGSDPLLIDIEPLPPCNGGGDSRGCDFDRTSTTMYNVLGKNKAGCGAPTTGGSASAGGYVIKFWGSTVMEYGYGCQGSSGKAPLISSTGAPKTGNGSFAVLVSDAKAQSAGALFVGYNRSKFGNVIALPWELTPLGAPKCWLWTDIAFITTAATSATGQGSAPLPIPNNPALVGQDLFFQWAVIDQGANKSGLSFSSGGMARLQ